jgi:hypothetical protein
MMLNIDRFNLLYERHWDEENTESEQGFQNTEIAEVAKLVTTEATE